MPRPHKTGFLYHAAVLLALTFLVGSPSFALTDTVPADAAQGHTSVAGDRMPGATDAPQAETVSAVEGEAQTSPKADGAKQASAKLVESYGKIPLHFEPNQGQTDAQVKFLARGPGYTVFLTPEEAVLSLVGGKQPGSEAREQAAVRMRLDGANAKARMEGLEALPGKSNYFIGSDPKKWRANIQNYAKVRQANVYPGIDLVYYGNPRSLEYDFVVAPGSDPGQIRLSFQTLGAEDASALRIENGDLLIETAVGALRFKKPLVYQDIEGTRQEIAGEYKLLPPAEGQEVARAERVGFELAAYDHNRPLVIDPSLTYSTYLGGNNTDIGYGIAVNSSGEAYVTGSTASTASTFPYCPTGSTCTAGTPPSLPDIVLGGATDAYVTKFNAAGTNILWSTYLGGSGDDIGYGIALDSSSDVYVTGQTTGGDFPMTGFTAGTVGGFDQTYNTNTDAFVVKLNANGSALAYTTYIGGTSADIGYAIAVDGGKNAYVVGSTGSTQASFPDSAQGGFATLTIPGYDQTHNTNTDVFLVKLNPGGTALLYGTYLGGAANDIGYALAVDGSGNAYVTGTTASTDFPVVPAAPLLTYGGGGDAFVAKINTAVTGAAPITASLVYSTYLGGSGLDIGRGIAVDSGGNVYVTGDTTSSGSPFNINAIAGQTPGGGDAFVTKINSTFSAIAYSTLLGGGAGTADIGYGIAVDGGGSAYVTGTTSSTNFPNPNCNQCANAGASDAFVARLTAAGSGLHYSTYLGGGGADNGHAIAIDSSCNVYVTGDTLSSEVATPPFPTGPFGSVYDSACGTAANCNAALSDAFVTKLQLNAGEGSCTGAPPPPTNPTLTIDGLGTGTGTVTATTPTISCTSTAGTDTGTCSGTVTSGSTVTLTATPASGSTFGGWTGGSGTCTGTTSPCTTAAITSNTTIQATFNSPAITVTGAGTGTGTVTATTPSISCTSTAGVTSGTCVAQVTSGSTVTLTASPASGSTFGGWTGTTTGTCTGTASPCTTAAITTSTTVQATFTSTTGGGGPFALNVTGPTNGIIISGDSKIFCDRNAGPDCTETYTSGTPVALTAVPEVGYSFASWGAGLGSCSGSAINPCTVSMTAATTAAATMIAAPIPSSGPLVTTTINSLPGDVNRSLPAGIVNVQYTIRSCTELYLIVNAPILGYNWVYFDSTGTARAITSLSAMTPNRTSPLDGTYTLYAANAPAGTYDLFLVCDNGLNGSFDFTPSGLNGVYTHLRATMN